MLPLHQLLSKSQKDLQVPIAEDVPLEVPVQILPSHPIATMRRLLRPVTTRCVMNTTATTITVIPWQQQYQSPSLAEALAVIIDQDRDQRLPPLPPELPIIAAFPLRLEICLFIPNKNEWIAVR